MYCWAACSSPRQEGIATRPARVSSSHDSSTAASTADSLARTGPEMSANADPPLPRYGDSASRSAHSPELMSANQTRSPYGMTLHAPGEFGMKPTGSNALYTEISRPWV